MCARGRPVSFAQRLICAWMTARSFFDDGFSPISRPASRKREHHVVRQDETVPAQPAQQILPGIAAEPAAVLAEIGHQPDLIVGRPLPARNLPKLPCSFEMRSTKAALSRTDLIFCGLRTMRLSRGQLVPEIVGLEQQPLRLEAEEGRFEARPFLLDHAPDEAGRENALGYGRQDAVVGNLGERLIVRHRAEQRFQHVIAALAFGGARPDFGEIGPCSLPALVCRGDGGNPLILDGEACARRIHGAER